MENDKSNSNYQKIEPEASKNLDAFFNSMYVSVMFLFDQ